MGVHVLDTLVRPVEEIPEGQGGALVEEIRMTAAGSAAARRSCWPSWARRSAAPAPSATTRSATCWCGCSSATASTPRSCCGATRSRRPPACCRSARRLAARVPRRRGQRHLRPGGRPLGRAGRRDAPAPRRARVHGRRGGGGDPVAGPRRGDDDLGRPARPGRHGRARVGRPGAGAPRLPPAQRRAGDRLHRRRRRGGGLPAPPRAGRRLRGGHLRRRRRGARRRPGTERVPAFAIGVVDTTGCGDAFSAGFLRGLALGRDRTAAATLGVRHRRARRPGARLRPRRVRSRRGRCLRRRHPVRPT